MERPVGDIFEYNGVKLCVVRAKHQQKTGAECTACYPYQLAKQQYTVSSKKREKFARQICCSMADYCGWCGKTERADKQDVIFQPII